MHKLTLVTVGSPKASWIQTGLQEYEQRIQSSLKLERIILEPSRQKDPEKQREEESAKLLKQIEEFAGQTWLLDEFGTSYTSKNFAAAMDQVFDRGEHIMILLCGAYGCTDAVRSAVDTSVRLSDMTLPHELCQVVFLEQLYRALQIQKGTGYHH